MSIRLNRFRDKDKSFYFRAGQVVPWNGRLFQHQVRYRDSFGADPIGHFMIDERDSEVQMEDDSLSSFRKACDALSARKA